MTFLVAVNCTMLFGLWAFVRQLQPQWITRPADSAMILVTFLGAAPLGGALFLPLVAPQLDLQQWSPELLLVGAAITAGGCSTIFVVERRAGMRSHFAAAALAILLASVYLAYTAIDHLVFYSDHANTGYLDASIATEAGIRCEHGFVLVKVDAEHRSVTYRCPTNIVLGDPFDRPFVPWPSYREGVSTELVHAIERLQASTRATR